MNKILTVVALLYSCVASAADSCVILKRASAADHAITGIEFYYVEGTFPQGYSFRTNFRGRHIRRLVKQGGRFVALESKYTLDELRQAKEQCAMPSIADKAKAK